MLALLRPHELRRRRRRCQGAYVLPAAVDAAHLGAGRAYGGPGKCPTAARPTRSIRSDLRPFAGALANMGGEFLTSAQASQKLWPSSLQACWLLVWYGLLVVSLRCAAGHQWRSFKGNLFLHCTERIPNPDFHSDDEDDGISRKKLRNKS